MRRAVRYGLLPVVVLAVAAVVGLSAYSRGGAPSRALSWDLDIERAMDAAGVAPGMIVGEAGAGDGYFTLPMARRVGAEGAVYANDISRRALTSLAENARREQLPNVHTVEGTVDDPLFPRTDLALVVVVHAFHDFSRPVDWLVNLKKSSGQTAPWSSSTSIRLRAAATATSGRASVSSAMRPRQATRRRSSRTISPSI